MANNRINEYLKFANLQMAAEAFLTQSGDSQPPAGDQLVARLRKGNTHASVFPLVLAASFKEKYEVVAQYRNDPNLSGGTGFSGTLFRDKTSRELTLSFRSTEFLDDALRDNQGTNVLEVKEKGQAFGKIADRETFEPEQPSSIA